MNSQLEINSADPKAVLDEFYMFVYKCFSELRFAHSAGRRVQKNEAKTTKPN